MLPIYSVLKELICQVKQKKVETETQKMPHLSLLLLYNDGKGLVFYRPRT